MDPPTPPVAEDFYYSMYLCQEQLEKNYLDELRVLDFLFSFQCWQSPTANSGSPLFRSQTFHRVGNSGPDSLEAHSYQCNA
jgi:hypothetical protein